MELGKRIAEIRKEHNLTQEDLAEICSVTRQTISNWENGKSYPDLETLVLLSDTFDVSLDAMLKGDRMMVSEITKEQKQGRKSTVRIVAAVIIAVAIITCLFLILENSFLELGPNEYTVTVTEITLDDVIIDKDKKIATYKDPNMEVVAVDGATVSVEGNASSEGAVYVFGGEEYKKLLTTGHAYKVDVSSDKCFDTLVTGEGEDPKAISISVKQSIRNKLDGHKGGNYLNNVWFKEIDTIYDQRLYERGDKDAAVVWHK